jgi:hypothetical protein
VEAAVDDGGFALHADPVTGERVLVSVGPPEHAPARPAAEVEAAEAVSGD